MGPAALLGCINAMDPAWSDFPQDPDAHYAAQVGGGARILCPGGEARGGGGAAFNATDPLTPGATGPRSKLLLPTPPQPPHGTVRLVIRLAHTPPTATCAPFTRSQERSVLTGLGLMSLLSQADEAVS